MDEITLLFLLIDPILDNGLVQKTIIGVIGFAGIFGGMRVMVKQDRENIRELQSWRNQHIEQHRAKDLEVAEKIAEMHTMIKMIYENQKNK